MRRFPYPVAGTIIFLLVMVPLLTRAQTKKDLPADLGWGTSWTAPVDEHDRQRREFLRQCALAANAQNYQQEISLCNPYLQKEPTSIEALVLRADAARHLKHYDQALADVDHAREIAQRQHLTGLSGQIWNLRAHIHAAAGDYPASLHDLQTALELNKKDLSNLNDLAWLRATAPDATVRDGRESVSLARKAVSFSSKSTSYAVTDTLAAAYAEANDYPRAIDCEKVALNEAGMEIKDAAKALKFRKDANSRLQLFEQHQPFHAATP